MSAATPSYPSVAVRKRPDASAIVGRILVYLAIVIGADLDPVSAVLGGGFIDSQQHR